MAKTNKNNKKQSYWDDLDKLPYSQKMIGKTVLVLKGVNSWYGEVLDAPSWDWFVVGRGDYKDTVSIYDIRSPMYNI